MHAFRQGFKKNVLDKFIKYKRSIEDFNDLIKTVIAINDKLFFRKLKKREQEFFKKKQDPL